MKIALFGTKRSLFSKAYTPEVLKKLGEYGELSGIINRNNLDENASFLADCEVAFSTWGMPRFTKEEIAKYMPKLKAVFYSAGTVQYFARPFLECGVRVFSAFAANAVPVAEYTFAQITLAAKGYFRAAKHYRVLLPYSFRFAQLSVGNFGCKVGLVGLGAIGKMVAERLGIPFYYKEMTVLAAEESGLDREFISGLNRNSPRRLHDLYLSRRVVRHAIRAQYKVIQKIADNGSCVIVGRAADFVLRDRSDVVRVFIHAPEEYRIKRVMELYGDSKKEAEKNIKHSDKARASYYKHVSGLEWGDGAHYDIVIDSSVGLDAATESILAQLQSTSVSNK